MKRRWRAALAVTLVLGLAAYGVHWAFFDIQRIVGQVRLQEVPSPDGRYVITAYLNSGGATTDYAVLCSVTDVHTGRTRNIYWQYHCYEADVQWTDNDTARINGVMLDVWNDAYDYRRGERRTTVQ